jgi:hypothetical protein
MKYVREASDSTDDLELKSRINDLYTALLDVRAKVLDLDEENRQLRTDAAKKGEIVGPEEPHGYFFFKDKPENPLCPKCFQSQPSNSVYLSGVKTLNSGAQFRRCVVCRWENCERPSTRSANSVSWARLRQGTWQ